MPSVLLGMSGGVDSTAAALILRRRGYDVRGITFLMHDAQLPALAEGARRAADEVGIPLTVLDLRERFRERVIAPFAEQYFSGRTPNPCALCNERVKFPELLRFADENSIDYIATGHYADVVRRPDGYFISAARDAAKDQTYFLCFLGQDVLSRLTLPLSGLTKPEVRALAAEAGLHAAESRDSQDVCFIPDGDCGAFLDRLCPGRAVPGCFTDPSGAVLGPHTGIGHYTVGQRRGLGVAADSRLYVKRIDAAENRVILCRDAELYEPSVTVSGCSYAAGASPAAPFRADVRLRYTRHRAMATVTPLPGGGARIEFDVPQRAPAPGQAAAFYDGPLLLGGGTIE